MVLISSPIRAEAATCRGHVGTFAFQHLLKSGETTHNYVYADMSGVPGALLDKYKSCTVEHYMNYGQVVCKYCTIVLDHGYTYEYYDLHKNCGEGIVYH